MRNLTASPIAPKPKIATDEPACTLALFQAAPIPAFILVLKTKNKLNKLFYKTIYIKNKRESNLPVETPQLSKVSFLRLRVSSVLSLRAQPESTTVYSVKVEEFKKW